MTVFDFLFIYSTPFDFLLYCPSWYSDTPFVLHQQKIFELLNEAVDILRGTEMTLIYRLDTVTKRHESKAAVLAELCGLIDERVSRIDAEIKVKQDLNIKEAVAKLREAFDTPGTKAIKILLGKMGVKH